MTFVADKVRTYPNFLESLTISIHAILKFDVPLLPKAFLFLSNILEYVYTTVF